MNWGSAAEFFAMGGKAYYVWGAYLVTLAVMAGELWVLRKKCREARGTRQDSRAYATTMRGENETTA